jgi:hypothetical protein
MHAYHTNTTQTQPKQNNETSALPSLMVMGIMRIDKSYLLLASSTFSLDIELLTL